MKKILAKKDDKAKEARERLLYCASLNAKELFEHFNTDHNGYDDEEVVDDLRKQYGKNEITRKKGPSIIRRLFDSFVNPFTVVLFLIAVVSFITDVALVPSGERNFTAIIIVTIMVFISGMLRFVQETRSSKAAKRLSEMIETTIAVRRGSLESIEIPINEIVVGDIINLAAGDMVPADVRIIHAKDLFISQSSLTGESEPMEKFWQAQDGTHASPLEYSNLAFMGSNVVSGSAVVMAITVGDDTIFGSMAKRILGAKVVTSFERGVNSVSWLLIRFMAIMVPLVFFINGFTKGNWIEALLFAISIAVGLTPEMLPMIVSVNLARGAVSMSKRRVIVKDLNSIQNFGAMDLLCTDKTGTLTQDKVVLEYHLNINGDEDIRVLRYAFLNSYHQTGLRNLMDVAIIKHTNENLFELCKNYRKVDEIPFDFGRRRMSVVVSNKTNNRTQLITKGAVEEMLEVCSFVECNGEVVPITDGMKQEILETASCYNKDGFRVLGIAYKNDPSPIGVFSVADETDMIMMGYLAFLDPPKESTEKAIAALNEYGVAIKILTGDNEAVTRSICAKVGLNVENLLLGPEIEMMSDEELSHEIENTTVFAKLSPQQKSRIVSLFRDNGHVVGFLGDGINDAAAMKAADVGISVDTAVDVAKESANIILLEKDLMVLERGVIEGRKTYANIIKYIKMTASSNFGNMFSVLVASSFLPFLPMLPIQILVLNLIYDLSCVTIPWDNVDPGYLKKPKDWDASSIAKFMLWIGPTSSVFDITTYLLMFFIICPAVFGGSFASLDAAGKLGFIALFHTGWFVESLWSQTLVIHMIRTPLIPFIQSTAAWQLTILTTLGILTGTILPYTPVGSALGMLHLPPVYFGWLILTIFLYMLLVTILKKVYIRKYGELL